MPTFVPHLRLNTTTNWFGMIGKCAEPVLNTHDIMELGRREEIARCAVSRLTAGCGYRPTDLQGLYARLDQLEAQLPMQTQLVQFPYENTLTGSEVFAEGYSHLAPELDDWYGSVAPGRDFSIFIHGHHFS